MKEQLEKDLESQIDKPVKSWEEVYSMYGNHPEFISTLLKIAFGDGVLQEASTWLIKHSHEAGRTLGQEEQSDLIRMAPHISQWRSKIHLLQLFPTLKIEEDVLPLAEAFIRQNLDDPNAFVRAWAVYDFAVLAVRNPPLREEALLMCTQMYEKGSGAVKVRARNGLKLLQARI